GSLRALKRNVTGLDVHDKLISGLEHILYPAALNIAHNTSHEETWIQRTACTDCVRQEDLVRLRRISADRLVEFTESIDDLFVAYEALYEGEDDRQTSRAVGVGVFYYEEVRVSHPS